MKFSSIIATGALAAVTAGQAVASTIDFESTAVGTYSSLTIGDATFSFVGGSGLFDVGVSGDPGSPISGNALISYFTNPGPDPFMAVFANGASSFTIGVGDFNADEDHAHLRAYSASNVLLASADYVNPAPTFGGDYLSVSSSTPIAYVTFWEDSGFAGAVYWDNVTITAVPEPSTYALMALGLAGVGILARRRKTD